MGPRKGGGRSGFVKSARSARPEGDVEASEAAPAPAAAPAANPEPAVCKSAAFLKDPPPSAGAEDSDSGSEDEGQAPGGETRGKMVQRHKKVRPPPPIAAAAASACRPRYHSTCCSWQHRSAALHEYAPCVLPPQSLGLSMGRSPDGRLPAC